jgi:hypothetical protein
MLIAADEITLNFYNDVTAQVVSVEMEDLGTDAI